MVEKLVPKLRFNEFHDEWNIIFLNSILSFKNGFNAPKDQYGFGTKFINVSDILENNYLTYDNIQDYVNVNENELNNYIIEYGDIVFQRSSENREEVGTANVYLGSQPCVYGGFVIRGKKEGNYNPFFLKELLQSTQVRKEITSWSGGSTRYNIGQDSLNKISISLPSIEEQNKIADLLLKVYEKVDLLEYKYHCYKNFKKYLMQNIFTQKLRFDFNDEWKIMRLNEITFYQEGPGVRNYQYTKEGVKLLNVGNFVNNILELDNTDRYISEEEAYGKYNHFLVDEGDLLIACSGIKAEYFDEKIAFAEKEHLPLCMNTSTMRFKSLDENTLNLKYLKYYFQTESFKKQVFRVMTGSAQFNFGPTHLKYFKIPVPCLDEQIKIYQMFESIDLKILNINEEIMKVTDFKKSLLQQMFI